MVHESVKLKDLIKKLEGKPNQDAEVHFLVFESEPPSNIVCIDMSGPATADIMHVMAKHAKTRNLK